MTDFDIQVHFHCESAVDYTVEIPSSRRGKTYRVRLTYSRDGAVQHAWTCECKSFEFRGDCKHINQAKEDPDYCGWQQFVHGGDIVRGKGNVARCPECNNLAHALRYAV